MTDLSAWRRRMGLLGFALILSVMGLGCSSSGSSIDRGADGAGDVVAESVSVPDVSSSSEIAVETPEALEASEVSDVVAPDSAEPFEVVETMDATDTTDAIDTTGETGTSEATEVAEPPQGCCADDEDCLFGAAMDFVCRGQGLGGEPWGVCALAPEEGRCYADSDCAPGRNCKGAALCPCNMDCDMDYEGPGVCVPPTDVCVAIKGSWVQEWCDEANLAYWDGEMCRQTDFGECGCEPFCEHTFYDMASCLGACGGCVIFDGACDDAIPEQPWWYFDGATCVEEDSCVCAGCPGTYATLEFCEQACHPGSLTADCQAYIAAPMDCPYAWKTYWDSPPGCPEAICMESPCAVDADCVPPASPLYDGESCVLGNCVTCWQDSQCGANQLCRAGRCVWPDAQACEGLPSCEEPGCHLVQASEVPCPVCVCDSIADKACSEDVDCLVYSSYPYSRCVYGRCADCASDADCAAGTTCAPPGMCVAMAPAPQALIGTWLIGWGGGMDHFSYFRFEADGVLRRGRYPEGGAWADDIPGLPCWPAGVLPMPLIGTWEPVMNESGSLVVAMSLNIFCDPGDGWDARFLVTLSDDGTQASFLDIDTPDTLQYTGFRQAPSQCEPDFSLCEMPSI